jgi:hypothetical protein
MLHPVYDGRVALFIIHCLSLVAVGDLVLFVPG